jgi:hypothetical protein
MKSNFLKYLKYSFAVSVLSVSLAQAMPTQEDQAAYQNTINRLAGVSGNAYTDSAQARQGCDRNDEDCTYLAKTLYGEMAEKRCAGEDHPKGEHMYAVARIILNRAGARTPIKTIVQKHAFDRNKNEIVYQFHCWDPKNNNYSKTNNPGDDIYWEQAQTIASEALNNPDSFYNKTSEIKKEQSYYSILEAQSDISTGIYVNGEPLYTRCVNLGLRPK